MLRRYWLCPNTGSVDNLHLENGELPPPPDGFIQVRIEAIGLNFADVFACLGLYSATPKGAFIPGLEFSGVIEKLGPVCQRPFKVGDRVSGVTRFGAYADHINVDERCLSKLPSSWTFAHGAAWSVAGLTAWYALVELGHLKKDQLVLLHSAAGAVGLSALKIIKKLGAKTIGTISSSDKLVFLMHNSHLDESNIIIRRDGSFKDDIQRCLGIMDCKGIDLVLDSLGGGHFWDGYELLNPGGRLVQFGAASMMPNGPRPNKIKLLWQYLNRPKIDPLNMIAENKSIMAFNLIWLWDRLDQLPPAIQALKKLDIGPPPVREEFAFNELPAALKLLKSGKSMGKIVVYPGQNE